MFVYLLVGLFVCLFVFCLSSSSSIFKSFLMCSLSFQVFNNNSAKHASRAPTWGVSHVGAPNVWALGHTGSGIVVAGQDTGYAFLHQAILSNYRGFDGSTYDHTYSWHDSISSVNAACPASG